METTSGRSRAQSIGIGIAFVIAGIVVVAITRWGTVLRIDAQCHNGAFIEEGLAFWYVESPELPADWQNRGQVRVSFDRVSDDKATMEIDGLTFALTTRDEVPPCVRWPG